MSAVLKALYESGQHQEVLDQFIQNETQGKWSAFPEDQQIECIYYKSRALGWLGRTKEALQTATIAREIYTSPKNPSYLLGLLAAQYYAFFGKGHSQLPEAQSILVEGETILNALTDMERQAGAFWIALFDQVKGLDYAAKVKLTLALEYFHKALKAFEALNNSHSTAHCLFDIAYQHLFAGEDGIALDFLQQSLTLNQSLGNKTGMGLCLHAIGLIHNSKGDLGAALEYYNQSLKSFQENQTLGFIVEVFNSIGQVFSRKGNPTKALDYFHESLAIIESRDSEPRDMAYTHSQIGRAYHQQGDFDNASTFLHRSLDNYKAQKDSYRVVTQLFHLVLLSLDHQAVGQAQKYLVSLQEVTTSIPDEATIAHLRKRLAEALVLKQSPRLTEKIRAQTLLKEIVNEEVQPESSYTLIAMVALCDLLLLELKATGEPEAWDEAKALIHQFYLKTQDNQDFNMVINALLLRAKFAIVEGEFKQAQEYFNRARTIVKEKQLDLLLDKVDSEQKKFDSEFLKWQDLIQQHASLEERLIQAQIVEYIKKAQQMVHRTTLTRDQ